MSLWSLTSGQRRLGDVDAQATAGAGEPPLRFAAGADAVAAFERRANNLLAQANAYRVSSSVRKKRQQKERNG